MISPQKESSKRLSLHHSAIFFLCATIFGCIMAFSFGKRFVQQWRGQRLDQLRKVFKNAGENLKLWLYASPQALPFIRSFCLRERKDLRLLSYFSFCPIAARRRWNTQRLTYLNDRNIRDLILLCTSETGISQISL